MDEFTDDELNILFQLVNYSEYEYERLLLLGHKKMADTIAFEMDSTSRDVNDILNKLFLKIADERNLRDD